MLSVGFAWVLFASGMCLVLELEGIREREEGDPNVNSIDLDCLHVYSSVTDVCVIMCPALVS